MLVFLVPLVIELCRGDADLRPIEARIGTLSYSLDGIDEYTANLTLVNTGKVDIDTDNEDVSLYICFIRYRRNRNIYAFYNCLHQNMHSIRPAIEQTLQQYY